MKLNGSLNYDRKILAAAPAPKSLNQRKILSLDGGGIRGIISLEILKELETQLRGASGNEEYVLSDYFDYFAGTSTGALIASCLALGWPVDRVLSVYMDKGDAIFHKAPLLARVLSVFGFKYERESVAHAIQSYVGSETVFGDSSFKSLVLAVTHNSKTNSAWPLSNNPDAKFNDPDRDDCNMRILLWQVLRASTAAPFYFPPERIDLPEPTGSMIFVDGGVTPSNNPALQVFLQATHPAYQLEWKPGADNLLIVSVGTGTAPNDLPDLSTRKMNLVHTLKTLPGTIMNGSSIQQDLVCRMLGHCTHGHFIDGEVGELLGDEADRPSKAFTYVRYNALLTTGAMDRYGLPELAKRGRLDRLKMLDSTKDPDLEAFAMVGKAAGKKVDLRHVTGFKP